VLDYWSIGVLGSNPSLDFSNHSQWSRAQMYRIEQVVKSMGGAKTLALGALSFVMSDVDSKLEWSC
jgi:hypothetical protein